MGKPTLTSLTTLAILLTLTACGSSNKKTTASTTTSTASTPPTTTTQATTTITTTPTGSTPPPAHKPVQIEKVQITSPAVTHETLAARYTCNTKNTSPPFHWTGIPANTHELLLTVLKIEPVNGKLFYDWSIAGLNPHTHGIKPGHLPPNAIIGNNSNGQTNYYLCPITKNQNESYLAILYALPHPLHPKPGFNPITTRQQAINDAEYDGHLIFHTQQK